jgi:hypothetical protein
MKPSLALTDDESPVTLLDSFGVCEDRDDGMMNHIWNRRLSVWLGGLSGRYATQVHGLMVETARVVLCYSKQRLSTPNGEIEKYTIS